MSNSPNLALPYIDQNQSQKHVTHNAAIRELDAIVQLSVIDDSLTAPPGSPADGDRYIVAGGATGAWTGKAGKIAAWQDGAWSFYAPKSGWRCYIASKTSVYVFSGSAWESVVSELQNLAKLGVGTAADSSNPFSAKLNASLWTAKYVADGGNGDLRFTLNKESAAKTVSQLYQTNWSGRAEVGLTGDDDFHVKVSADGTTWKEAIVVDRATGAVAFPSGGPTTIKTLVIIGSSNGAGLGSSTYVSDPSAANGWSSPATSWAGLLTSALISIDSDWSVYNRSISGSGTSASIARFWSDVAPHRPSHVLFCTHPLNDSLDSDLYIRNTISLIGLCRSIGAQPIIRGAYTYNGYTASQYRSMLDLNRQLDRLGVARIDHMSLLDNGTGAIIGTGAYDVDGLHLNDAGQAAQYSSIDLGLFLNAITDSPRSDRVAGAWRVVDTSGSGIRINSAAGLRANVRSFTMRARIKGDSALSSARAFMLAYIYGAVGTQPLRVRNAANVYELADAVGTVGSLSAVNPSTDTTPHDLVMTFNHLTNLASLYIDGALVTSGVLSGVSSSGVVEFGFGSRSESGTPTAAAHASFSDISLWQVPLSSQDIADLHRTGRRPSGSLILDAEMSYSPPTIGSVGRLINTVRNGVVPLIGEARWESVPAY
jgi:hypothetical protein